MFTTNKPAEESAIVSNACVLVGQAICCTSTDGTCHYYIFLIYIVISLLC